MNNIKIRYLTLYVKRTMYKTHKASFICKSLPTSFRYDFPKFFPEFMPYSYFNMNNLFIIYYKKEKQQHYQNMKVMRILKTGLRKILFFAKKSFKQFFLLFNLLWCFWFHLPTTTGSHYWLFDLRWSEPWFSTHILYKPSKHLHICT